ncbi:MAG TPA: hypothetical protein VNF68_10330 [Candidatus Baltobacteraceae bacterium]|nr:hypothetical protein [Candidatus Baltobacteraceae bacterium]
MNRTLATLALLALVTGCAQSGQSNAQSSAQSPASGASAAPVPTNPTDFPLYQNSAVIAARDFSEKADAQTVSGTEVIAENPATLAQLGEWIKGLSSAPPAGYAVAVEGSGVEIGRTKARALGVEFQAFTHVVGGKKHATIVLAVDPKTFDAKAGFVLSSIGKFKMLPQSFKDAIDAQAKNRTGFTVSEMLDRNTPMGAALAAVQTLNDAGDRGVVVIDGTKN